MANWFRLIPHLKHELNSFHRNSQVNTEDCSYRSFVYLSHAAEGEGAWFGGFETIFYNFQSLFEVSSTLVD